MTRLGVCLLALAFAAAAWAEEDYVPAAPLHEAGLVKYWQLQLPLERDQVLDAVYLVDDHIYAGTDDGYAFCVHAATGVLRWIRPITHRGYRVRKPAHSGERVIFATPTDFQIYHLRSGDPIARKDFGFPVGTGVACDGRLFFVGGLDRRIYSYFVDTQIMDWRAITSGPISQTPRLLGELIIVANDNGDIYAAGRSNKEFRWQANARDRVSAEIAVSDAGVFIASRDMSLYLFDPEFGNIRWRARFGSPLLEAPLVTPELVYQHSNSDGLVAVEADPVAIVDERIRWRMPTGRMALTVHQDQVYAMTIDAQLAAVRTRDGRVNTEVPIPGFTMGMPAPDSATVYLAGPDGRLFCARPRGVPPLTREDILAALRPAPAGAPPGARVATTQPATTRPAPATGDDAFQARRGGVPLGGRSKVTREFERGAEEKSESK